MPALRKVTHGRNVCYCKNQKSESPDQGQALDFRLVICYALRHFLLELEFATHMNDVRAMLVDMQEKLRRGDVFEKSGFFSLYPLPDNVGVIAVDDASGCAPLVLKRSKEKFSDFQKGLQDLVDNLDSVVKVLARPKHVAMWTDALHKELDELFNPTTPYKEAANG